MTKTLIPLAAIDDIIGVAVFFTVISLVSGTGGSAPVSPIAVIGMLLLPFAIGIFMGIFAAFFIKRVSDRRMQFALLFIFLCLAAGKIGGAYLGGKITGAEPVVTKYLGFTLLPHSGVSLVFTGIAVSTLTTVDASLAPIVSGTIVAAAIINEIIAVIIAKYAFKWAGEIAE